MNILQNLNSKLTASLFFYKFSSFSSKSFMSCADCGPEVSLLHEPGPGQWGHQHHGGPQRQDVRAQVGVRGSPPGGFEFVGSSVFFSQEWYKPGPKNLVALSLLFYPSSLTVSNFALNFLSITPLPLFLFQPLHTQQTHTHTYIN
jgi:hypothetical protein